MVDLGSVFPSRPQAGLRWNHLGAGFEFSLWYFDGFNYLPRIDVVPDPSAGQTGITRVYSPMRMAGGDAAWPLKWFTLKAEAAYFWTTDPYADDYGIYVIQVERQQGEWLFVGGLRRRVRHRGPLPALDAGLRVRPGPREHLPGPRLLHARPAQQPGFEGAIRPDAAGGWLEMEYSRAIGQHWRATARGDLLAGSPDDFFGQYRRNSSLRVDLRFSY